MLSKKLQYAVAFAQFCKDLELTPQDGAKLVHLAKRAALVGVRECNDGTSAALFQAKFDRFAIDLGLGVAYNSLVPEVIKGKRLYAIPLEENFQ